MIRTRGAWALALLWGCASNQDGRAQDAGARDVPADVPASTKDVPEEDAYTGPPVDPIGPLPAHDTVQAGRFMTHDNCALCHAPANGVMRDPAGRDVSPPSLWRTSMMAMAARDPYWLAAFERELSAAPAARELIEQTCTRCHAPAGAIAMEDLGERLRFEDITQGGSPESQLALEGVTCTVCHQTTPDRLGTPESFTGRFTINTQRRIYGPHATPFTTPMQVHVRYTPTEATHMTTSALCGTCHTVITRALDERGEPTGPEFPEQASYLEWRNSAYRDEGTPGGAPMTCQGCHMPTRDADGMEIRTILSNRPGGLRARAPIGRHLFAGANGYMLSMLAAETEWTGSASSAEELTVGAELADGMLRRAAAVRVESPRRAGDALSFSVRVSNTAGHRFPTGYPSRRAWLHVRVLDETGAVRFESGRADARGRLIDREGRPLEARRDVLRPHLREVTREDQVQVYESVMGDRDGRVTHLLLRAERYLKDNRLLPRGWRADHADARLTSAVGVDGDDDFRAGEDLVRFAIPAAGWTPARVEVELLFQSVAPDAADAVRHAPTPSGARFNVMVEAHPPTPRVAATADAAVP